MLGLAKRRHERELADALAASIDAVQRGVTSVDDCLARYPHLATELQPLLLTSVRLHTAVRSQPSEAARLRARGAFLSTAAGLQGAVTPHPLVRRRAWLAFAPAAMAAALFAVIAIPVIGTMDTSAVPGDWNYSFKRATERVRLALTTDSSDRRMLRLEFARRRLNEIEKLSSSGQQPGAHQDQVTALLLDYTSDIRQITATLQSASTVPDSTRQQLESVTQQAITIVQPLAASVPQDQPVKSAADQAVNATRKADDVASAIPTPKPANTVSAIRPTRRPVPSAAAAPSVTASSTDTPVTVTPSPTATGSSTPAPTSTPPVATATPSPSATPTP
ncbi:MAG: DUF5667 domain-containing protein, partial [Dehalococcoidia bacterium]